MTTPPTPTPLGTSPQRTVLRGRMATTSARPARSRRLQPRRPTPDPERKPKPARKPPVRLLVVCRRRPATPGSPSPSLPLRPLPTRKPRAPLKRARAKTTTTSPAPAPEPALPPNLSSNGPNQTQTHITCPQCGVSVDIRDEDTGGFTVKMWEEHRDGCFAQTTSHRLSSSASHPAASSHPASSHRPPSSSSHPQFPRPRPRRPRPFRSPSRARLCLPPLGPSVEPVQPRAERQSPGPERKGCAGAERDSWTGSERAERRGRGRARRAAEEAPGEAHGGGEDRVFEERSVCGAVRGVSRPLRELRQVDKAPAEQHVLQHPVGRASEELFGEEDKPKERLRPRRAQHPLLAGPRYQEVRRRAAFV
ncbi:hypothetical protein FA13DRAFT_1281059 [Coprinellus micaceus]|uniref:Uncharacterized protein n=1 Tax=Coprinellus micaceus TaxID=71717 RepID=A0A4Y7SSP9_COPMI|nr:hypothetical protein FA13DRAFT_1281059 [Coprinellus micaceus]